MRAELPWNVAGIPPEAREAARAAARREGLSVGEWLTRRILRSFSDLSEEPAPPPERPPVDSWGLPQSAVSRRDTEEMLARVSRSESESGDVARRIEEQLRGVARRLDSSERNQTESNRVLSKTAAEMNIAAREQAQAFDQLGQAVEALNRRMEALENSRTQDGLRDAVKGLHLGLSRLADQITATATQSAGQIAMVAGNVEQVASRLVEVRGDSENRAQALDDRLGAVERLAHSGAEAIDNAAQRLEQRLGVIEKSTGDVIGRGLERLEQRLGLVEKTAGEEMGPGLEQLAHRLGAVEQTASEHLGPVLQQLEQRLGMVEHSAGEILGAGLQKLEERLGLFEKTAAPGVEHLAQRVGAVEQSAQAAIDQALDKLDAHAGEREGDRAAFERHTGHVQAALARLEDWVGQLDKRGPDQATGGRLDNIEQALTELVARLEHVHPAEVLQDGLHDLAGRIDALEVQHGELLDELRAGLGHVVAPAQAETQAAPAPPVEEHSEAPPFAGHQDAQPEPGFADLGLGTDFAPERDDEHYAYPETDAEEEAGPAAQENFLSAARRSARAASEKAESEKRGHGFAWSHAAEEDGKPRARYLILGGIGLIVVALLAAGLVLSARLRAPRVEVVRIAPRPKIVLPKETTPDLSIAPPAGLMVAPPPVAAKPAPAAVKLPPMTAERVAAMAAAGNTVAQTIVGLRYLDGTGGARPDPAGAAKWLGQAAAKGQAVAQYRYGTMFERGEGMTADPARAVRWYLAAATQGNRKAMHNLAVAYAQGTGGRKDMAEAARWFAKAAGLGLSDSQFNLAVLYERGDGVPQSLIDAYKWYAIAAAQGDGESRQRLSVLQAQLAPADRAAAQRAAENFHAAPLSRAANLPPEMGDLEN